MQKLGFYYEIFIKIFIFKTTEQNSYTNSPWVYVIKVSSNGDATYIISDMTVIAKDNMKVIANLMQTFENLLLQNYWTAFFDTTRKLSFDMQF